VAMTAELKGILAYVYENAGRTRVRDVGGAVNMLAGVQRVIVVDDEIDPVLAASPDTPAVRLVRRWIGGKEIVHAEPVEGPGERMAGPMMGGAYIASSDGRFGEAVGIYGAIPLHDRFERPR
jgi:hypothetical protein